MESAASAASKHFEGTDSTATTHSRSGSSAGGDKEEGDAIGGASGERRLSPPRRYALSVARSPERHLSVALSVTLLVVLTSSIVTLVMKRLEMDVRLGPWLTRDTLVSNRAMQSFVHLGRYSDLFGLPSRIPNTDRTWADVAEAEGENPADWDYGTVPYREESEVGYNDPPSQKLVCGGEWYGSGYLFHPNQMNLMGVFRTVDATAASERSALEANALYEMCRAEEHVLGQLEASDLCYKCNLDADDADADAASRDEEDADATEQRCIQPYSIVAAARLYLSEYTIPHSLLLYVEN